MANGNQLREMLAQYRDQKFRKRTDAQLHAIDNLKNTLREKIKNDPEFKKLKQSAMEKSRKKTDLNMQKRNYIESVKKRLRPFVTPFGIFPSRKHAAEALNIDAAAMQTRMKNHNDEYYYQDTGPGEKNTGKAYIVCTPFGEYRTAQEFNNATNLIFTEKRKSMPHLYYYKKDGPGNITYEKVNYTPYGYGNDRSVLLEKAKKHNDIDAMSGSQIPTNWMKRMSKKFPDQYYIRTEPRREWLLE